MSKYELNGKSVTPQEYLYGEDVEVPEIPAEVIMRRVELLKEKRFELLEVNLLKRDGSRVNSITKAIDFWEALNES